QRFGRLGRRQRHRPRPGPDQRPPGRRFAGRAGADRHPDYFPPDRQSRSGSCYSLINLIIQEVCTMTTIFDPITLGDLQPSNRIIMAPLTRCRADEGRVPNAMMAEYYVQRASAGLIISEATSITPMGVGYPDTPGIWSNDQVRGWSNITKAVHAAGGKIVLQ